MNCCLLSSNLESLNEDLRSRCAEEIASEAFLKLTFVAQAFCLINWKMNSDGDGRSEQAGTAPKSLVMQLKSHNCAKIEFQF